MSNPVWRPDKPWNDLPRLPPNAVLETKLVLKQCIKSREALAEMRIATELIPNEMIFLNSIVLLEAQQSCGIENIVTTTDRLFQCAQMSDGADPATKEALRYRQALLNGFDLLTARPLSTFTAVQVCGTLKGVDLDIRKTPGTALLNGQDGGIVYTPPEGEQHIRDLLANWEMFLHSNDDLDPLVRMAIGHYQFEAIHPFIDGNGRTGRILNILWLNQERLISSPIFYLSRYIIATKTDYYQLLLNVTKNQGWEAWILYMLRGVEQTARWTVDKIKSINNLMRHVGGRIRDELPAIYSRELVDIIFAQPYCRINNLTQNGIAKRQTASKYLKELERVGILRGESIGKEKLFINPALMQLLTS